MLKTTMCQTLWAQAWASRSLGQSLPMDQRALRFMIMGVRLVEEAKMVLSGAGVLGVAHYKKMASKVCTRTLVAVTTNNAQYFEQWSHTKTVIPGASVFPNQKIPTSF